MSLNTNLVLTDRQTDRQTNKVLYPPPTWVGVIIKSRVHWVLEEGWTAYAESFWHMHSGPKVGMTVAGVTV